MSFISIAKCIVSTSGIICLINFCFSCAEKPSEEIPIHQLKVIQSFDQLDTFYLSDVRSIDYSDGHYYISDYFESKIFKVDERNNLETFIGDVGRGPGELLEVSKFYIDNSTLLIMDSPNQSIKIFNKNGDFVKSIVSDQFQMKGNSRFSFRNGILFLPNYSNSYLSLMYNVLTNSVEYIGKLENVKSIDYASHILTSKDRVIILPLASPKAYSYDMNGNLVESKDFSGIAPIEEFMRFHNIYPSQPDGQSFYVMTVDATLHKEDLYILYLTLNDENKTVANSILKCEVYEDEIVAKELINLGEGDFSCFNFGPECLVAYDQLNGKIKIFEYDNTK